MFFLICGLLSFVASALVLFFNRKDKDQEVILCLTVVGFILWPVFLAVGLMMSPFLLMQRLIRNIP